MKFATVHEIRDAIVSGKMTAVEVTQAVLDDIRARNGKFGAFLETFDASALEMAAKIDAMKARGEELPLLAGVPVAVKDNMMVEGHASSSGSRMLEQYVAPYSATVVERLEEAGAVIIGRTNMDEFAMGSSTETSAYFGETKTCNPWDTSRIAGGSSGGSAVAVAAGFVPIALGSDTGGSIRQPAALCGIVGMKPSYGRVSRYGITALASSLDQVGPFARNAEDAAIALNVIEGRDEHDSTSLVIGSVKDSEKPLRIGVVDEVYKLAGDHKSTGALVSAFNDALNRMSDAKVADAGIEVSIPSLKYSLPTYYIIQPAEASSNLARFDGMRYGTRAKNAMLDESYFRARGEGFGMEVKRRIMLGTFILSAGYSDAFYKKALAVRSVIRAEFEKAFEQCDVIAMPTAPSTAWKVGEKFNDPMAMYLADIFTVAANIAGLPAISVPCGIIDGLPVGIQFIGPAMRDDLVLRAAREWQAIEKFNSDDKYIPKECK